MDVATITSIIVGVSGALILGMAALIKGMVVGRLDSLQTGLNEMRTEIHDIDLRVTKLETEHSMRSCRYNEVG